MIVQSYTSWQPLEEVIVGRVYDPKEVDFIDNPTVREKVQQILYESAEDLDNLAKTIEHFGATVRRPTSTKQPISAFVEPPIPIPPLTPRDWQITLGEKILRSVVIHIPIVSKIVSKKLRAHNSIIHVITTIVPNRY